MKKFFYTLMFALVASLAISSCADEIIQPADGTTGETIDCQTGGPCPKNK